MSTVGEELYWVWANQASPWSAWAKPAVFATFGEWPQTPPALSLPDLPWALGLGRAAAVIVDVPDGDAVLAGLALAKAGFQPVPLFNGCASPNPIVDVAKLADLLSSGAEMLRGLSIGADAPPAFLLDARRRPDRMPASPGRFDNRWVTFPQDFPSARRLAAAGITTVLLYAKEVEDDLAHVLMRYKQAGLELRQVKPEPGVASADATTPLDAARTATGAAFASAAVHALIVAKPSRFLSLGFRAALLAGLRHNPAGGFGARVPSPYSGGG